VQIFFGIPEGVQDRSARLFTNYGLELQEGSIRLLFKRSIQCANRYNEAGGFLRYLSVLTKLGLWTVLPFES
jgi:hypothetical protein